MPTLKSSSFHLGNYLLPRIITHKLDSSKFEAQKCGWDKKSKRDKREESENGQEYIVQFPIIKTNRIENKEKRLI